MIKLLTGMAGDNFSHAPGEKIELDAETEQRMVDSGQAEFVNKPSKTAKKKQAKNTGE